MPILPNIEDYCEKIIHNLSNKNEISKEEIQEILSDINCILIRIKQIKQIL